MANALLLRLDLETGRSPVSNRGRRTYPVSAIACSPELRDYNRELWITTGQFDVLSAGKENFFTGERREMNQKFFHLFLFQKFI
jgi:hypothetical protein